MKRKPVHPEVAKARSLRRHKEMVANLLDTVNMAGYAVVPLAQLLLWLEYENDVDTTNIWNDAWARIRTIAEEYNIPNFGEFWVKLMPGNQILLVKEQPYPLSEVFARMEEGE